MDLGLNGKRALVLGASRGLGRAIAEALAAEGAIVTIVGRDGAGLADAAQAIAASCGAPVQTHVADLARADAVDALADSLGDVDVLVLNGGGPAPGAATGIADDAWRSAFETMALAPMRLVRAALPGMRERRFGRVLLVLSSGVVQPIPNLALSNAMRLSLVGWAKTLAAEVAADGITVNGLLPGRIHTGRVDELDAAAAARAKTSMDEVRAQSRATIPAGRYGRPEEFAAVAAFLASDKASYVTGTLVRVDGGMIRAI
ncbi:MAG: SDR family oxidoreductase [Rhizomicrobium sp.]